MAAVFVLLGVYLSIRSIAALYRVLDLWYAMPSAWPLVLRGLLLWPGGTALAAWALPPALRASLLWGLGGYLAFYLLAGLVGSYAAGPRIAARLKAYDRID